MSQRGLDSVQGPPVWSLHREPAGLDRTDCRRPVSLMAPACSKCLLYIQDSATGLRPPGVAEKKTWEYGQEEGGLAWGRGYSQAPDCRVRTKTRGLITRCRQLRGRFQFLSSLSGSTRGTVRSSRNSTGSCPVCTDGRVSPGRPVLGRPYPELAFSRKRLLLIKHPLRAGLG